MSYARLRVLETAQEMEQVVELQRQIWPGSETGLIPVHLLLETVHNGGLVIGAYARDAENRSPEGKGSKPAAPDRETSGEEIAEDMDEPASAEMKLAGFVFGFPGFYRTPDGPRLKHCSHLLGVHPRHRGQGLGFVLKRAQWQMVRHQGIDRITWSYDPLFSQNAYLNITLLGGVSNTYQRDNYCSMQDGFTPRSAHDRFQVDWWVHTQRVIHRLSSQPRKPLDLAHFLSAGVKILNPTEPGKDFPRPGSIPRLGELVGGAPSNGERMLLVEIPPDFDAIRESNPELTQAWRLHSREVFETLFDHGYLITDFIYLPGAPARSFYVASHGESTL